MMMTLQSYVRQSRHTLRKWAIDPRFHLAARLGACFLSGFVLSAASLAHHPLPLAMGWICALNGWSSLLAAVGSMLGFRIFWGVAAGQCVLWSMAGACIAALLANHRLSRDAPLLIPALAGLTVAALGVVFQSLYGDQTPVAVFILRIVLAMGAAILFSDYIGKRNPLTDWLTWACGVLALSQITLFWDLNLGLIAAGALMNAPFPAAVLAAAAVDLSQITPVSITAVAATGYLLRFLPRCPKWVTTFAPVSLYFVVMSLGDTWDVFPVFSLFLGGVAGNFLPGTQAVTHRRGETGAAQVRLELTAGVLSCTQQLLMEIQDAPVDEQVLVAGAAQRACSSCPSRKACKDARRIGQLPGFLLHKPLLSADELPIICRKSGRFLAELHRGQEQLRSIHANRQRQQEYRTALIQQYHFLSDYLQELSDQLGSRNRKTTPVFTPVVQIYGNRPEADNGDRCLRFTGTACRYYVLLCDGMGTGMGAVQEGKTAAQMLKKLLCAGYPTSHALRSLNSLCALRERAGAFTVDLAEIMLDTGKVTLYKWGAAPSYLMGSLSAERIGTPTPPPGISVTEQQEQTMKVSMRRGEMLVMVSDGVEQEDAFRCCREGIGQPIAQLGTELLTQSRMTGDDDATAIIVYLK